MDPKEAATRRGLSLMHFTVWAMSSDPNDLHDGERPVGEFKGKVQGYERAIALAKQILIDDPDLHHVRVEPSMAVGGIKAVQVRRTKDPRHAPEQINPHEGEDRTPWRRR